MGFRQRSTSFCWSSRANTAGSSSLPVDNYDPFDVRQDTRSRPKGFLQLAPLARGPYARLLTACMLLVLLFYFFAPKDRQSYSHWLPTKHTNSLAGQKDLKCIEPFYKANPLRQWALMVDAGSTGSRIHVYTFNNCGPTPELENEVFQQTKPGLSSYKADAEGAAKSLDPLLEVALESVPASEHSCTPIAVKATAGLRILGQELSEDILKAVRTRLETSFPFPLVKEGGVSIMDGKDEGVYAWITTNYLLGKIGGPDKNPSAAVFDLGGGSTQIVFEPTFSSASGGMPEQLAPGDHKYELQFSGQKFDLYQHSHLGYGLMEARKSIHKEILKAHIGEAASAAQLDGAALINPCIAPGMSRLVELESEYDQVITVNMTGPEQPAEAQCRFLAETILRKDAECKLSPCSFNGIHQPSLSKTFGKEDVYIFSYFYDRTAPLGMPSSFSLKELQDITAKVCGGQSHWESFASVEGAMEELLDRPEHCLDLNFMLALLHTGYEMPLDRQVKIAKKIKGNELGWCLGASLPLLDRTAGGWQCKIREL